MKLNTNEYKNAKAEEVVEFETIPVGPQVCIIRNAIDFSDKEYIKVLFDINTGDFKDYFANHKKDGLWINDGTHYASYKSKGMPFFRAFITSIEKSNPGYNFERTGFDEKTLIGKLFVVNFAQEQIPFLNEETNEPIVKVRKREIRSIQALKNGEVKTYEDVKKLTEAQYIQMMEEANKSTVIGNPQNAYVHPNDDPIKDFSQPQPYHTSQGVIIPDEDLPF